MYKLESVKINKIPGNKITKKRNHNIDMLQEFIKSNQGAAKIIIDDGRKPKHVASSLGGTRTKLGLSHVRVIVRGGDVYLINEILADSASTIMEVTTDEDQCR